MKKSRILVLKIIAFGLPFLVWTAASLAAGPGYFPLPWETIADSALLFAAGGTWHHLGLTALRVLAGFGIALFAGLAAGLFRGIFKPFEIVTDPLVHFFQRVPPILWAIPVLFIAGFGFLSPVLVIVLIVFPLVTINISEGMKTLPRENREMLALFAPRPAVYLRELIFPHLGPSFSASLKIGLSLAVKASVTGEFFCANDGAGFMLNAAYQNARIRSVYAWGLLIILFIMAFDLAIKLTFKFLVGGREKERRRDQKLLSRERTSEKSGAGCAPSVIQTRPAQAPLRTNGVCFSYAHHKKQPASGLLLKDISLTLPSGTIVLISGDSGIGKTTLLKLMAGLLTPQNGSVERPGSRISFMFQEDRLLPHRTALGNAALPCRYADRGGSFPFLNAARVLSRTGMGHALSLFPDELSGGMKRRLSLARCFSAAPSLILLDEPFHGLQKEARAALWAEFINLWQESPCPAAVVTHYPEEFPEAPFLTRYRLEGKPATLVPQ